MGARQVDALRYIDFANYIIQIDAYWENEKKKWESSNNA